MTFTFKSDRQTHGDEEEILVHLTALHDKGLIKAMENNAFTRVVQNERSVKVNNGFEPLIRKLFKYNVCSFVF